MSQGASLTQAKQQLHLTIGRPRAYVPTMSETPHQRRNRLALFARDTVKAKSDYQKDAESVIKRTARLREERLQRELVIPMGIPKAPKVGAARIRKSAS
jgi:hypothetical protein